MTKDNELHLKKNESDAFLSELYKIHGERFAKYREDWDRTCAQEFVSDFPLHLELEINNYCNLKCKMCHFAKYFHNPGKKKDMDLDLLDVILEQCKGRLPAVLIGSGAESLLHPQIEEIIGKFYDAEIMDIIVSTNGLLLTEKIVDLLIALQIARITISVDAVSQHVYKKIRGGNLALVEKNILRLIKAKEKASSQLPYLRLTFVMQPENMHEEEAFRKKWTGVADRIDFQKLLIIDGDDIESKVSNADIKNNCAHPFQRVTIDFNGDVYPCCTYYKKYLKLGNIKESSIQYLWKSQKMEKLRQSLKERKYFKACRKCLNY